MRAERSGTVQTAWGAGRWYPADGAELAGMVDGFLAAVTPPPLAGPLAGGIAPHAGYVYSGEVAAHTYRALRAAAVAAVPETVVVLGFSHRENFSGLALLSGAGLRTPLGVAPLDVDAGAALVAATRAIRWHDAPHAGEHSAENQVPFLQRALPDTRLVIGLLGEHGAQTLAAVTEALLALSQQRRVLVVASTDLLHDPDYALVTRTDRETLGQMAALDEAALARRWRPDFQVCCGIGPVRILLRYSRARGCAQGVLLHNRNSGDTHPESRGTWVVGYGALVFPARD